VEVKNDRTLLARLIYGIDLYHGVEEE
jgi:hypothetical protein